MNKTLILLATFLFAPQFIQAQTRVSDDEFIADQAKYLQQDFSNVEKQLTRYLAIDGNTTFNESKEKYLRLKTEEAMDEYSINNNQEPLKKLWLDSDYHQLEIALPARDVIKDLEYTIETNPPHVMLEEAKKLSIRVKNQNLDIFSNALSILETLRKLEKNARRTANKISDHHEQMKRLGDDKVVKAMGFENSEAIGYAQSLMPYPFKSLHETYEKIIWCLIQPRGEWLASCY